MRKVLVLYNPASGLRKQHREAEVNTVLQVLREAGAEARASRTGSHKGASEQSRAAVAEGCDGVFVCGGDGTIHDVLQGMVGSQVPLAIIPRGTANALAHDLGIPGNVPRAVEIGLHGEALRVPVGKIEYQDAAGGVATRFFTVAAGVGVDASLFYQLGAEFKSRFGMAAYCAKALHIWFSQRMPYFELEFGAGEKTQVTELLAVRIRDFGNVLRELAPGASLAKQDLRLVLCRTDRRLNYLAYVLRGLFGLSSEVPGIELRDEAVVTCRALQETAGVRQKKIHAEADGELLGNLPARITIVPDALTLIAAKDRRR